MKIWFAVVIVLIQLCGCGSQSDEVSVAMELRERYYKSSGCQFQANVCADYGDCVYIFGMDCRADNVGTLDFKVTEPQTIEGITGCVTDEGGKLTFDDKAVLYEPLADGQVIPAIAPWLMIRALRSGYIKAVSASGQTHQITFDDTYQSENFQVLILVDEDGIPVDGEIIWQGRRILTLELKNFAFM